jgi:hypothetical protein
MIGRRPTRWLRAAAAPLLVLLVLLAGGCSSTDQIGVAGTDGPADYAYLIPPGTGEEIRQGAQIEILPAGLTVQVGEVLEIVNEDDEGHLVGPFFVGAGETLRQEFVSPGVFEGICTVHPSGQFVLTVQ